MKMHEHLCQIQAAFELEAWGLIGLFLGVSEARFSSDYDNLLQSKIPNIYLLNVQFFVWLLPFPSSCPPSLADKPCDGTQGFGLTFGI